MKNLTDSEKRQLQEIYTQLLATYPPPQSVLDTMQRLREHWCKRFCSAYAKWRKQHPGQVPEIQFRISTRHGDWSGHATIAQGLSAGYLAVNKAGLAVLRDTGVLNASPAAPTLFMLYHALTGVDLLRETA